MKNSRISLLSILTLVIFLTGSLLIAKPVYVKSFKGIIKDSPKGTVIAKVSKGTKLNQIGKEGIYAKVKYNGKVGYISTLYVSSSKPAMSPVRFNELRNPNVIARRRASAEVTAASARGAADENEMLKIRGGTLRDSKIDLSEVKIMENYDISLKNIEDFLSQGNISPK